MNASTTTLVLWFTLAPAAASAQPADDGYCDYVKGTASASAATLFAPQLFTQFGYIEQLQFSVAPDPEVEPNDVRVLGGIRYSFSNILQGQAIAARAEADCRRHRAQVQMQAISQQITDTTAARAIAARLKVLDEAQVQADKMLAESRADLEARRITAQEAISTRTRVEDLRATAAQSRRELAALPSPDLEGVDQMLADYRSADADFERAEGRLRTTRAFDFNVRAGADRFLGGSSSDTRYFAVVELGINLGALWIGSGNKRSREGRARYAQTIGPFAARANPAVLRPVLEVQSKRLVEVKALSSELDKQLAALQGADSNDAKKFRETVWFEAVRARAELAYLQAHVATLAEMLGATK